MGSFATREYFTGSLRDGLATQPKSLRMLNLRLLATTCVRPELKETEIQEKFGVLSFLHFGKCLPSLGYGFQMGNPWIGLVLVINLFCLSLFKESSEKDRLKTSLKILEFSNTSTYFSNIPGAPS